MAQKTNPIEIPEAPLATFLFRNPMAAFLWLFVRLYIGYQWLEAGWHKFTDAAWMVSGTALQGFWTKAIVIPAAPAKPIIVEDWFRSFLEFMLVHGHYVWFAKFVSLGELAVGLGLILGVFTGIAAFFGVLMNTSYLFAGALSTNPLMLILGLGVMGAWRVAGYLGADHWLLPWLGAPWRTVDKR